MRAFRPHLGSGAQGGGTQGRHPETLARSGPKEIVAQPCVQSQGLWRLDGTGHCRGRLRVIASVISALVVVRGGEREATQPAVYNRRVVRVV